MSFQALCPKSGPIESNLFIADDNECEQNMDDKWKFEIQQNFVQMVERLLFQNPPNLIFVWKTSSLQQQLKSEMIFLSKDMSMLYEGALYEQISTPKSIKKCTVASAWSEMGGS